MILSALSFVGRYFVEQTIVEVKDECCWDEFQAQKYLVWQHHLALTTCALWFITKEKLRWGAKCARDPDLIRQPEIEALPALSTANVRELLKTELPLPEPCVKKHVDRSLIHHKNR